jgi:hypothetical protein
MTTRLPRRVIRDWFPDTDMSAADWLADHDHGWTPTFAALAHMNIFGRAKVGLANRTEKRPPTYCWAVA